MAANSNQGLLTATKTIYAQSGLKGFWRGLIPVQFVAIDLICCSGHGLKRAQRAPFCFLLHLKLNGLRKTILAWGKVPLVF